MFRKILVPLDGSELAEQVLKPATALAQYTGGELFLLRVPTTEAVSIPSVAGYGVIGSEPAEDPVGQATDYLRRVEALTGASGIPLHIRVVEGDVRDVIINTAFSEGIDLITMSSHGYSGVALWVWGSVTDGVLRRASCPVLAIRSGDPIRKILVPLDGSELSERVLEPAFALAASQNAEVTLLRIVRDINLETMRYLEGHEHGLGFRMQEETIDKAAGYLSRVNAAHSHSDLKARMAIRSGPVASMILEYAELYHIDLIAMSTHGWTGRRLWAYGSVTEKVLHGSRRSMLIVRPAAHLLN